MRSTRPQDTQVATVVGIDDWTPRKGHRYGTIIVDLESGMSIDLLPDRGHQLPLNWRRKHIFAS